jgi:imidazolonepropionase-like amidohydrolase
MLVGLGTDVPYGGMWSGDALHREMEIWVNESGVSPLRTIQAVTYDNARIMKFDDRTGSIQPGMEADLLVVRGNPASNISDTRNIEYIFSNGKLVDRESLTRQWKP